jgi:hypothetical protein
MSDEIMFGNSPFYERLRQLALEIKINEYNLTYFERPPYE